MAKPIPFDYEIFGEQIKLLPQKALYWPSKEILVIADVHFGKVGHFRKAGIAIPKSMEQEDLAALSDLLHEYKPRTLIFLGDFFHSEMNNDWNWFELWRQLFTETQMILVRGNHDLFPINIYIRNNFEVVDTLSLDPFVFLHEPAKENYISRENTCVISGHIHPGIILTGKGRQKVSLPCFFFGKKQIILPAFGKFTGKYCIEYKNGDRIFGITGDRVVEL